MHAFFCGSARHLSRSHHSCSLPLDWPPPLSKSRMRRWQLTTVRELIWNGTRIGLLVVLDMRMMLVSALCSDVITITHRRTAPTHSPRFMNKSPRGGLICLNPVTPHRSRCIGRCSFNVSVQFCKAQIPLCRLPRDVGDKLVTSPLGRIPKSKVGLMEFGLICANE